LITIRPIQPEELDDFVAAATAPADRHDVKEYVMRMFASGCMRPEWCYLAEQDGLIVGRASFWTLPKLDRPLDYVLIDLPWEHANGIAIGEAMLDATRETAHALGADELGYCLDTPPAAPFWQHCTEARMRLMQACGFRIARETYRFELKNPVAQPEAASPLYFRSYAEVGEVAFREAIARVSAGTFDQRIREGQEMHGAELEARNLLRDLQQLEYDPAWWQLAYNASHDLVGLIMPVKNPTFASIGYIGVVPEQRGRGYVDLLLRQGTNTLALAGEMHIRADTDLANFPMATAFRRAGYSEIAIRREYVK